ncbi:Twin-arginine translocation protein TatC [Thioalkalivibrio nitratireducens DSM 14787]|uniref:Sec-independent protein translocase protein TatC n=1 Tax=Thioalkalivibrio nitratireducens (strain DSM 14787 / UNIQEM 213 / ALEN2) TaxID=1255043 RepID=L0DS09_THIND|nr:twin-arginine translocase subunit TatC [Thioalkalivibrio nitratireducens]AGA31780.1 Twin-arginine translocation protein TatC [Thioalkalivibrio nitratireducens DSM 14787]
MSKDKSRGEPSAAVTETLLSHLIELRDRILRMFLAILVVFLLLFPFANQIYTWLATPLMVHLPEGTSMIAIEVAAPFLIPFKLVLLLAVVLTIPYTLYQFWAFIAPGLYKHEKRLAAPLVASSTLLFYLGMAFAYFVVFPLIFAFFTATAPEGVAVMTDISRYLDFVIMLFLAFGIAFEVPIATILLVSMGATTPAKLARKRPYVIVGTFVVGMVLTPPDIISQTLLALPMWLLFEIGLILSRIMERRKADRLATEGTDDDGPDDDGPGGGATRPGTPGGDSGGGSGGPAQAPPARDTAPAAGSSAAAAAPGSASATVPPDSAARDQAPASPDDAYRPLTEGEMDAELDRLEVEQSELTRKKKTGPAPGDDDEDDGEHDRQSSPTERDEPAAPRKVQNG